MDREIEPRELRRRRMKKLMLPLAAIVLAMPAFILGPGLLRTSLQRQDLMIARVTTGPLSASIFTSGTVEPELEHVISSPFGARILRVLRQPGAALRKGDAFLELDTNQARLAMDKLEQQIRLKQIQQNQSRLELGNTLITLNSQLDLKRLEVESTRTNTTRLRQLFQEGLLPRTQLDQAVLEERKASMELSALEARIRQAQESNQVQIKGLETEMDMLRKELTEARRQLELATATADAPGVLTWVRQDEGATVPQGDVLGRMADLSSYRVRATVSDVYARSLHAGQPVIVRINEQRLNGAIRTILPTVTNGSLAVLVALDQPSTSFLKPNLRVDVEILTSRKDRTLLVKRGAAVRPDSDQEVYVIRGSKAVKTLVRFGMASVDQCEILSGAGIGDELILNDLAEYRHLQQITIR